MFVVVFGRFVYAFGRVSVCPQNCIVLYGVSRAPISAHNNV